MRYKILANFRALPGMSAAIPFMAAAVLLFPLAGLGLVLTAGTLSTGNVRGFPVLAVNHIVTLGWGTMIAMGALHQMFPAMIGVPLRPGRAALMQFGVSFAGMATLTSGFLIRQGVWVAAGGALAWTGIVWFAWLVLRMVPARRRWTLPVTGVVAAVVYLVITATWGLLMSLNWRWGFWPALLAYAGVGTHAALGIGGWFVQLVINVSYYLLPRFTGASKESHFGLSAILVALNAAIAAFVAAAFSGVLIVARIGALMAAAAGLLYAASLPAMLRPSRRAKPDLTIHHWWAVWGLTGALSAIALIWALGLLSLEPRSTSAAVGVCLLLGWVTLAIMGQLYKVTPFLMWYYRYARGLSAYEVPRLEAPYYPVAGIPPFYLTLAGSTLLALGVLITAPVVVRVGSVLFLAGAVAFWLLLAFSWINATVRCR